MLWITFRRSGRLSEMIQIFNVLFEHIMQDLQLVQYAGQHFDERAAIKIPEQELEVLPGYDIAIDSYKDGGMLTLEYIRRGIRTQAVLPIAREVAGRHLRGDFMDRVDNSLVMTSYDKKFYAVDDIIDSMNPLTTLTLIDHENGRSVEMNFVEYYKKNCGIDILDMDQPIILMRNTGPMPGSGRPADFLVCLVPELCQMTGRTELEHRDLQLMKSIESHLTIEPNQRHAAIQEFIESVSRNDNARARLAGWGLSISPEVVHVTGRTLPPETIFLGDDHQVNGRAKPDWKAVLTGHPLMEPVDIYDWIVLFPDGDATIACEVVYNMCKFSIPMGIGMVLPRMIPLPNDITFTYIWALQRYKTETVQLVVAICHIPREERDRAIQHMCCFGQPVPLQLIYSSDLTNGQKVPVVAKKALLKINCKLGGTLWHIRMPIQNFMIVGIATYHSNLRTCLTIRNVCGFVASFDQSATRWFSKAVIMNEQEEVVTCITTCMLDALGHYLETNYNLPDRIIVYRKDVDDDQLEHVKQNEVPVMRDCFSFYGPDYEPSLTYVVVHKSVNSRLFLKGSDGSLQYPNTGTVVDKTITRRDCTEFLLVSQNRSRYTTKPTHYVVAYDDSGMTPDQCQSLTFKMCHLYFNSPGTVKMPAPCLYAQKLANFVGKDMKELPDEELCDKLFFL